MIPKYVNVFFIGIPFISSKSHSFSGNNTDLPKFIFRPDTLENISTHWTALETSFLLAKKIAVSSASCDNLNSLSTAVMPLNEAFFLYVWP